MSARPTSTNHLKKLPSFQLVFAFGKVCKSVPTSILNKVVLQCVSDYICLLAIVTQTFLGMTLDSITNTFEMILSGMQGLFPIAAKMSAIVETCCCKIFAGLGIS
eukprot:4922381-Amphidinium_carterae.1